MAEKIIVIGSGFGGIAAALRMRARGYEVTLVEKHPDLGGRARVFKKGNFVYDGGPTVITAPYFLKSYLLYSKKISDYVKIIPLIYGIDLSFTMDTLLIILETIIIWKAKLKNILKKMYKGYQKFSKFY